MIEHFRTLLVNPSTLSELNGFEPFGLMLFSESVVFDNGNKMTIRCDMSSGSMITESILTTHNQLFSSTKSSRGNCVRGLHEFEYNGERYVVFVAGRIVVKRYAVISCNIEMSDTDVPFECCTDPDDISSDCNYEISFVDKESGMKIIDTEFEDWTNCEPS